MRASGDRGERVTREGLRSCRALPPTRTVAALAREHALLAMTLAAVTVKLAQVAVDSTPLLFWGDSWTHLRTAVEGHLPGERSWTYGFLIRPFVAWTGSLRWLVPVQALAGAATCGLLIRLLVVDLEVGHAVAAAAVLGFAFEPLQVLQERFVLTESFAGLGLALYVALAFLYLRRPRVGTLALHALAGIALVSLRTVYVPIALAGTVTLPLLFAPGTPTAGRGWPRRLRTVAVHTTVALLSTALSHVSYQVLTGRLLRRPPAYQYADGFFLASAWWQVLVPQDAREPAARALLDRLEASPPRLGTMPEREFHRWTPEGFCAQLAGALDSDSARANAVARETALRALRRDPAGVLRVAWRNALAFWERDPARTVRTLVDQGAYNPPNSPMVAFVREHFDAASAAPPGETPARRWHRAGRHGYPFLTLTPLACAAAALFCRRENRSMVLYLGLVSSGLLATTWLLGIASAFRFLHPMVFPMAAALAVLADAALRGRGPSS